MLDNIVQVQLEKELEDSYLSYAMSVIVSRAIPDVCDGLKPVHRRVLYAMYRAGYDSGKPHRKAARVVGDVMGKYHPHADTAIYDSLVRMAQDFSLRLPLIDGQGNFGSIDGDPPASIRYTEARLAKSAHFLLNDIDEDTVDFRPNYDGNETEPTVLPAEFPNILVNGAGGVAVGMSTNIPSHNLGEIIDACVLYMDNPDVTLDELLEVIPGPDFPTGGVIMGRSAIISAFSTGKGSIIIQGKTHIEELPAGRQAIIIDEIPYQVNKAKLIERIHELVKDKRIETISDLRDESNKNGMRVVIELKKQASADVTLNQIFGMTPLRSSFSINTLVLNRGRPCLMSLKEIISTFISFRREVVTRRTEFRLKKVREKAHVLIGLYIAVLNIDRIIEIIRSSHDPSEASSRLISCRWEALSEIKAIIELVADSKSIIQDGDQYQLTDLQVKSILDMRLQRLTGLEKEKLDAELSNMVNFIKEYTNLLSNREVLMQLIRDGLLEIKAKLATPRRTAIEESDFESDIEDLIPVEEMVITVTMSGYIKRVNLSHYRAQKRGGKGRIGQAIKEEDVITKLFVVDTHTSVLFFSNIGRVYKLKVYKLPLGEPTSRGRSLVNIFPMLENEVITNVMPLPDTEDSSTLNIAFATAFGNVRRNALSDFQHVPSNGKIAMVLSEGDRLISVEVCKTDDHIFVSTRLGKSIRFPVDDVRQFKGRTSDGVRAIRLSQKHDSVISMSILTGIEIASETKDLYLKVPLDKRQQIKNGVMTDAEISKVSDKFAIDADVLQNMAVNEQFILTITENGFGKRTSAYEYRTISRGGIGVVNILTTSRNGNVVTSSPVNDSDHIMLITNKGKLIRIAISDIRVIGRSTQGVTLFKTEKGETVVSAAKVEDDSDVEDSEPQLVGDSPKE